MPSTEAVLEPIAGRKSWDKAIKVYAEFGDLRQVNGYKLLAVLDDPERRRGAGSGAAAASRVRRAVVAVRGLDQQRRTAALTGAQTGAQPAQVPI